MRSHTRCELAFYTSMRESNALPAVRFMTGGDVIEVYDRAYNKVSLDVFLFKTENPPSHLHLYIG